MIHLLKRLWRWLKSIFWPKPPAPPVPLPRRDSAEYEQLFMRILENLNRDSNRASVQASIIFSKIPERELIEWLREFKTKLLATEGNHNELAGKLAILAGLQYGEISTIASNIAKELEKKVTVTETQSGDMPISTDKAPVYKPKPQNIEPLPPLPENPSVEELLTRGEVLIVRGNYQEAITVLQQARELDEDNPTILYFLGLGSYRDDLYQEAIDFCTKALNLKPNYLAALARRGLAYKELGDQAQGKADFELAVALIPQNAEDYYGHGISWSELGDQEKAIKSYQKAIDLQPNYHYAWHGLGIVLNKLGKYEKAIESYQKAIELQPNYHYAWHALGNALNELGKYDEAIESYQKAIDLQPNYHYAWNGWGSVLYHLGKYEKAIESYQKAIELQPNFHYAWHNWGIVLNNLGEYKDAIKKFDRALELSKNQYWESWVNRGLAFYKLFQYQEAINNWDQGLREYSQENHDYQLAYGVLHQCKGDAQYDHAKAQFTYWDSFNQALRSYQESRRYLKEYLKGHFIREHYLNTMLGLVRVCRTLRYPETEIEDYLQEATTYLENILFDQNIDVSIRRQLKDKFAPFYQLEVDNLVDQQQYEKALAKAEIRKNFCLQWLKPDVLSNAVNPSSDTEIKSFYAEIQSFLGHNRKNAMIYWHLSPMNLTTFIIRPGHRLEVLTSPFNSSEIISPSERRLMSGVSGLAKWLQDWKNSYQDYQEVNKKQPTTTSSEHPWSANLDQKLEELAEILEIKRLKKYLVGVTNLILCPHRELHILPLEYLFQGLATEKVRSKARHILPFDRLFQALATKKIRSKAMKETRIGIWRIPSVKIANELRQTKPDINKNLQLVCVENRNLVYLAMNVEIVKRLFKNHQILADEECNEIKLKEYLNQGSGIFHFNGHGSHNFSVPEESNLQLPNQEPIKVPDILALDLNKYYLVCLSACETGISSTSELRDEYVGLASGFLGAKTNFVISTLWQVEEEYACLLLGRFYQELKNHLESPSIALQIAQTWLRQAKRTEVANFYDQLGRDLGQDGDGYRFSQRAQILRREVAETGKDIPTYQEPYYWAGFILSGMA